MNINEKTDKIDIVIPWVDGGDPAWQAEWRKVVCGDGQDNRVIRYRDWGILKYWFRGVEKNLPWVNKVYFVTWGHIPQWLNTQCDRLCVVNHRDYIPEKYLPVFSSHPIEMNFHRINGLSEHFIYANDDMFFTMPLKKEFFFKNGLPVDSAIQNVLQFSRKDGINHIIANDLSYLNLNFDKREAMKKNRKKWFAPAYGKGAFQNLYLLPFANFTGFHDPHLPYSYLKSTFSEVWSKCGDILDMTCKHHVRSNEDVNQWLCRYWQFATGSFEPSSPTRGRFFVIGKDDDEIEKALLSNSTPMVCLSDDDESVSFEKEKDFLISCFEKILPEKSQFEL